MASIETQIHEALNQLARELQTAQQGLGSVQYWDIFNDTDSGDFENFQNTVCITQLSVMDSTLLLGDIGSNSTYRTLFNLLSSYFTNAVSNSPGGLGLASGQTGGFDAYLTTVMTPVPYLAALYIRNIFGGWLSSHLISAPGAYASNIGDNATAGLHQFGAMLKTGGTWAYTSVDGALASTIYGSPIIAVSDAGATGTVAVDVSCTRSGGTAEVISVSSTFAADAQIILGEQALGSGVSAGAVSISLAATGQFSEGDYAVISEGDVQEVFLTGTIVANTSIAIAAGLKHAFTTSAKVWPLFKNIASIANASGGNNSEAIQFYARPVKTLALAS